MRAEFIALVAVFVGALLFGCVAPPGNATPTPAPEVTPAANETPAEVAPFAAREGLAEARAGIAWLRADAELSGVQGTCDGDGKSVEWQYSFDSRAAGQGYVVSAPGGARSMRDAAYSFRQALGEQWADSTQAASACGTGAGDFSLEMRDGSPVWTVISGSTVCEVNASSGERMG
jgi:hypothetical protein